MPNKQNTADFFVATDGSDSNPGTLEKPFASLSQSRDAVRELKLKYPESDITVLFREGTYSITDTVVFGLADSASDDHSITYAAYPGEKPVFSSGVPVTGWVKNEEPPSELSSAAHGKIWQAPIPKGIKNFVTMYDANERLPRARTRSGFCITKTSEDAPKTTIHYPKGKLKNYSNFQDIELILRQRAAWNMNILKLKDVDEENCVAHLQEPATYGIKRVCWIGNNSESIWVENCFEGIREPGDWVVDTAAQMIYLWPHGEKPSKNIVVPCLTELIRIEGFIDYDGPEDTPVVGVHFKGITFSHADRFIWEKDRAGWGVQHDWEMFDRPTALIRFRGARECSVQQCRFIHSGGSAIRLDLYAQKIAVVGNLIENIGGAGIFAGGYGPGTKNVNKFNRIENNHIRSCGEILWHAPAIFAWQSGENSIAHNVIEHVPYSGIVITGRIIWNRLGAGECAKTIRWSEVDAVISPTIEKPSWKEREQFLHSRKNIVEYNDIHHTMEILGDGNGIYISGAGTGNCIQKNYIHDTVGFDSDAAIRCDDDQHETIIRENIIYRNSGSGIVIKGVNEISNNIIAHLFNMHRAYINLEATPVAGTIIKKNIVTSLWRSDKISHQTNYRPNTPQPLFRDCKADYNIYFCVEDDCWGKQHLEEERQYGIEDHSVHLDPLFVDIKNQDFDLLPDSPAHALGIKPLSIADAGLSDALPFWNR